MRLRRKYVGQAVQIERSLVREHPLLAGPKPDDDELLVLADRKVNESIDASPHVRHTTSAEVLEPVVLVDPEQFTLLALP